MYLSGVAHQSLRRGVDRVEDHELRNARRTLNCQPSHTIAKLAILPAPRTLAIVDSFL
jgi:hypothetical protein